MVKAAKNTKTYDTGWHKHYAFGGGKKAVSNDFIKYYYKNNGAKINVEYTDFRHNKACAYVAYDESGKSLGIYLRLYEAQKAIDLGK